MAEPKTYYLVGEYKHIDTLDKIGACRFYPVIKKRKSKNYITTVIANDMAQAENFLILWHVVKRVKGYLVFDTGLITSPVCEGVAK